MSNTFSSLMARTSDAILSVPTVADLPANALEGAIRYVEDVDALYTFDGSTWNSTAGVQPPSPAITTDNAVARWDGAVGAGLNNSGVIIDDLDNITGVASLNTITSTEISYLDSVSSNIQDQLDDKVETSLLGANNGVATLDGGGKVPAAQLPNSIMDYKGNWSAATNTPTLANGVGNAGDVYRSTDDGTVDFGAGPIDFLTGDFAIYSGSIWERSRNSNEVVSVNSETGAVVFTSDEQGITIAGTEYSLVLDGTSLVKSGTGLKVNNELTLTDGSDTVQFFGPNIVDIYVSTTEAPVAVYTDNVANGNPALFVGNTGTNSTGYLSAEGSGDALTTFVSGAGYNLDIQNSDGDSIKVKAPATGVTAYNLTLPAAQGAVNTTLKNDGAGGLTWATQVSSHTQLTDIGTNTHAQIDTHIAATSNPHSVTATQVGLGNVDNTSDATKNAAAVALTNKTIDGNSNTLTVLAGTQLSGVTPLANGGTAKALTAVNGGIVWSDADSLEISAAGTAGQILTSGGAATPAWVTTVPIANGGTGATTAQTAINALAGATTDNRVLQGNGTNIVLGQIDDPAFFTSGAVATSSLPGLVPTYSKGTFTPSYGGGGSSGGTQLGRYVKIGSLCSIETSWTNFNTDGNDTITLTLPFAAKNTSTYCIVTTDAGTQNAGRFFTTAGSATAGAGRSMVSTPFTGVGSNNIININVTYEVDE